METAIEAGGGGRGREMLVTFSHGVIHIFEFFTLRFFREFPSLLQNSSGS